MLEKASIDNWELIVTDEVGDTVLKVRLDAVKVDFGLFGYEVMSEKVLLGEKSGIVIRADLGIKGQTNKMEEMNDHFVYVRVNFDDYADVKVENVPCIDDHKGDGFYSRFVVQQYNDVYRTDTVEDAPPTWAARRLLSVIASKLPSRQRRVQVFDASVAVIHALFLETILVWLLNGLSWSNSVGKLRCALYVNRGASFLWQDRIYKNTIGSRFEAVAATLGAYQPGAEDLSVIKHGDDFVTRDEHETQIYVDYFLAEHFDIRKVGAFGPGSAYLARFLKRDITWGAKEFGQLLDPVYVKRFVEELDLVDEKGFEDSEAKSIGTQKRKGLDIVDKEGKYRAASPGGNNDYLAISMPDIKYRSRCGMDDAARAGEIMCDGLKKLVSFLKSYRQVEWRLGYQDMPIEGWIYCDAGFAAAGTAWKSTSCAAVLMGKHTIETTLTTQGVVELSMDEARFYALSKADVMDGFGLSPKLAGLLDSMPAMGVARRHGVGLAKHLETTYLGEQQIKTERVTLREDDTEVNFSDAGAEYLDGIRIVNLMDLLGIWDIGTEVDAKAEKEPHRDDCIDGEFVHRRR